MKNYSQLTRLERLQELKQTIMELIEEGTDMGEMLDNVNKKIEEETALELDTMIAEQGGDK